MSADNIFAAPTPRIFTIDPSRPFLTALAQGIQDSLPPDPLSITDALIYVPTRRAARALADAIARNKPDAAASLMPRIRALGDVDEDEIALEATGDIELPSAVSALERKLVLARFVAAAERAFSGQEHSAASMAAAGELASLLESLYMEEIPFERFSDLVPTQYAAHWERSVKFLSIITQAWPAYLSERNQLDPTRRRALLLDMDARRLEFRSSDSPVIVAGSTGSAPAVARLMAVVSRLPRGAIVLPGLDRALASDEKAWNAIEDAHPQAGLKALLARLGVSARTIASWPGEERITPRARLLSLSLRPAEATDDWRRLVREIEADDPGLAKAVSGLTLVEADDEEGEAAAIALALRETLETPARTAMLVTPDRNLARRVAARMRRWKVDIDDSAGTPFVHTPCGAFLRLLAAWLSDPGDFVLLLALLRAPMAGLGLSEVARARVVDAVDLALRGFAPGENVERIRAKLAASEKLAPQVAPALAAIDAAFAIWPEDNEASFANCLRAHIAIAESLATTDTEAGSERLWRGEDGETGALLLAELGVIDPAIAPQGGSEYAISFAALISGVAVRKRAPAHPRLSILGPLEARLQSADLVILGGLNEGIWPADAGADAFLSRPMRAALGLPSLERRIGLAAHDFAQAAAAPQTLLTRSLRADGAPSKPSRWIVRLKTILQGANALEGVDRTAQFAAWMRKLDAPDSVVRVPAPRPTPPIEARPRELGVTAIETWLRDPYAIYARRVLGLYKLETLSNETDARALGLLMHAVYEERARSRDPAADIFDRMAPQYGFGPVERAFWGPAIADAIIWFESFHAARLELGEPRLLEHKGELAIPAPAGAFTITAKADRIDILRNGSAFLVDYKSRLPSIKQLRLFSVQLPLTVSIVQKGGFAEIGARKVAGFAYVKSHLRDGKNNELLVEGDEVETIAFETLEGLKSWIAAFDDPSTPYLSQPRAEYVDDYGDYDHLARRRERGAWGREE